MRTIAIFLAGLSALATASPINIAKPDTTSVAPAFPVGSGSGSPPTSPPAGPPGPPGVPRPTAVPRPHTVGTAPCPTNGQLVCNGPDEWGLCNWNTVQFQHVAAGTQCLNGEIVFATGFGTHA